ncbi:MAG: PAS domain S-box protein [Spirochaetes bacterium]|nr:PAS domain S-box protein [Spirochaetota bacterium]
MGIKVTGLKLFFRLIFVPVFLFLLTATHTSYADESSRSKYVVIIHSYHSGLSWTDSVMNAVKEVFAKSSLEIRLSAEYLDARRSVDTESRKRTENYVLYKLKKNIPDLVIVSDNSALNFILKYKNSVLADVPVVFCGVNDFREVMISGIKNITGIAEEPSIAGTVYIALKFHPGIKNIIVIGRKTVADDSYNRTAFMAALPELPPRLKIDFWDDLSAEKLKLKIPELDKDSIIFINGLITGQNGNLLMYDDTTRWISGISGVPVYSLWDVYLGHGIIGGILISGHSQGKLAAETAIRILNGETPASIPVISGRFANRFMFDYIQLARFGIPLSQLPEDAIVLNIPDSFYHKYKHAIWPAISVLIILSFTVILLIIKIIRRRKTEETLRLVNLAIENNPAVLFRWKSTKGWPVEYVSSSIKKFGYTAEELTSGKISFSLIIHPDDHKRILEEIRRFALADQNEFEQEYRIFTKDGKVRWVNDHSKIYLDKNGNVIFREGLIIDITERKSAEKALRESEQKFRALVEKSIVGVFLVEDNRLKYINSRFAEIHGYEISEMLGFENATQCIHPEDKKKVEENLKKRASSEIEIPYESFRSITKQGDIRHIEVFSKHIILNGKHCFIGTVLDTTDRKRAEDALRESEKKFHDLVEKSSVGVFLTQDQKFIYINERFAEIHGYSVEEVYNHPNPSEWVHPEDSYKVTENAFKRAEGKFGLQHEYFRIVTPAGDVRHLEVLSNDTTYNGKLAFIGTLIDITDHVKAEEERSALREKLFQSQKMESIGLLAGGVAHDFNNILTPILGYSELLIMQLNDDNPHKPLLEEIRKAADSARDLTKRLLIFSRKQVLELTVVNIGEIIQDFRLILQRTIRENIEIRFIISEELYLIHADKGQIGQAILNLVINAQDAMQDGGVLTIEAKNTDLDETYSYSHPEVKPGTYVMLSVTDTGTGIEKDVQSHIFEPFFTTKEPGRGTGLGLATVYGIVEQHHGSISVYSETGRGSTFKIYLPVIKESSNITLDENKKEHQSVERGRETILLAEDNDTVRILTLKMLEELGYNVLAAENPEKCIEIANEFTGIIDLFLTDVIMPKMNGKELYEKLILNRPGLKVVYMSGYADNIIDHHGIKEKEINFLQKPFTLLALSQMLRQVLES